MIHNRYQQSGGEDSVFQSEAEVLSDAGHTILRYERDNRELDHGAANCSTLLNAASLAANTIWSGKSYRELLQSTGHDQPGRPDVAHFHNTLPLISPSAHWACKENAIPVVQTLHNYRLLCPAATFLRDGQVCESCLGKALPWPGVVHGCYRNSRAASGVLAAMLAVHRAMHTWTKTVDIFIALSEFAKAKFVQGGLPAAKIVVKPNFVYPDPGGGADPSDIAIFVGRLSEEKGLPTLVAAWQLLAKRIPLRIIGDGPLRAELETRVNRCNIAGIYFEGRLPPTEVVAAMKQARFLILPSQCYENFPMAIAEAFACGTPVIASRHGAAAEIVEDGRTGLLFQAGDAGDLAAKVDWAATHSSQMKRMGFAARAEFEKKYTAKANLERLLEIYARAISPGGVRNTAAVCAHA